MIALAGKNRIAAPVYDSSLYEPPVERSLRRLDRLSLMAEVLVSLKELQRRDAPHVFNFWMRMKEVRWRSVVNVHVRLYFEVPWTRQHELLEGRLRPRLILLRCLLTLIAQVALQWRLARLF